MTNNNLTISWNNADISVTNVEIISPQGVVIPKITTSDLHQSIEIKCRYFT